MEVFGRRVIDGSSKKLKNRRTPVRLKLKLTLELQPNGGAPEKEKPFYYFVWQRIKAAIMKRGGFTILRPRMSQARRHLTRRWSFTDVDSGLLGALSGQFRFPIIQHVGGVNLNSLR